MLLLQAHGEQGGRTVGIMTTHGTTGLGWDYRFTVQWRWEGGQASCVRIS